MQEFVDTSLHVTHFAFGSVKSTNDEAFRLGAERGGSRFFVTAKTQSAGRGRRGRSWVSKAGNLYTSIFLRSPAEAERCAELSFVAAVTLHEAMIDCTGEQKTSSCKLKWPNDVLWNGAKIAGLLLEAREQSGEMNVVVGMGVNCIDHPQDTPYPATSFKAEGLDLTSDQLFHAMKPRFIQNLDLWNRGQGFAIIRDKWLSHARGLGEEITVRLQDKEIKGQFQDIDKEGHLVLGLPNREKRIITAGDVFFPSLTR